MADTIKQRHGVGTGRAGSRHGHPGWCRRNRRRARLPPALEGLDDDHAPAAARPRRSWLRWYHRFSRFNDRRHREQRTGAGHIGLAAGAREPAVVSHAVKALQQHVQREAPDEFIRGQCHRPIAPGSVASIILVAERDAAFVERDLVFSENPRTVISSTKRWRSALSATGETGWFMAGSAWLNGAPCSKPAVRPLNPCDPFEVAPHHHHKHHLPRSGFALRRLSYARRRPKLFSKSE
jgi:hypothetical protein